MEFGMKKCGILTMAKGKVVTWEGIKYPNGDVMNIHTESGNGQ